MHRITGETAGTGTVNRAAQTPPLIGTSPPMQALQQLIASISGLDCTVLLCGASGTGKEVVAQHLHALSRRQAAPFIPVDCTALHESLFESQLFGHVRGAFTGAERSTLGFVRAADGGTLFLDEVGELPLSQQAKLLRVIQQGAVVPLGSTTPVPVDIRIVAATHRDLEAMVGQGRFREDLYYRLHVVRVDVPPLRVRRTDILALAEHFLDRLAGAFEQPRRRLTPAAQAALLGYAWPGNVRELANALEHACAVCTGDRIDIDDLPATLRTSAAIHGDEAADVPLLPLDQTKRRLIHRALTQTNGCQNAAARLLQIERRRLYRLVRRYGLQELTRHGQMRTV